MNITVVIVVAALIFVALLVWGDTKHAPAPVRTLNACITMGTANLMTRLGDFRYRRRSNNGIPKSMVSRHYLGGALASTRGKHPGIKILSPVTDPDEQRMFFLWEIGFHTELDLQVTPPNKIYVSKRQRKVLEEYCTRYANYPGSAERVFKTNGLVLETARG